MNLCIFTGRTTKDIELRYAQDNLAVGMFSLAVDSGYGDSKKTSFLNMTAFKKNAESMEKYVKKGAKILVQAEAIQNDYKDRDGNKKTSVNFIVKNWEFCESKSSSQQSQNQQPAQSPYGPVDGDGFMNIDPNIDDELPFS